MWGRRENRRVPSACQPQGAQRMRPWHALGPGATCVGEEEER